MGVDSTPWDGERGSGLAPSPPLVVAGHRHLTRSDDRKPDVEGDNPRFATLRPGPQ
jgi:hypothetical protein